MKIALAPMESPYTPLLLKISRSTFPVLYNAHGNPDFAYFIARANKEKERVEKRRKAKRHSSFVFFWSSLGRGPAWVRHTAMIDSKQCIADRIQQDIQKTNSEENAVHSIQLSFYPFHKLAPILMFSPKQKTKLRKDRKTKKTKKTPPTGNRNQASRELR